MKFKLLVILTTLTFTVFSVAYSDKEELFDHPPLNTPSYAPDCHWHISIFADFIDDHTMSLSCPSPVLPPSTPSTTSSPPSTSDNFISENVEYITAGIIIAGAAMVYLAIKARNNSLLFDAAAPPDATYRYVNQFPSGILVNTPLIPRFDFTRQAHDGWEFRSSFTFRF